jgi:RNA recognition motif-containing protein
MGKELYVGSLSYDTTEYELEKLFSVSGRVTSIHLITDPKTGEFKRCGYVRMSTEAEAKDAILSLDGARFLDKTITVSIANPQKQAPQGGYKGKSGAPSRGARGAKGGAVGTGTAGPRSSAGKAAPAKKAFSKPAGAAKPSSSKPAGAVKPSSSRPAASKKRP